MTLSFSITVHAAQSDWHDLGGGEARLLAVVDPATSTLSGGIEIRLKPGWKTYWRYPGSSGIPPRFDFSASQGFANSEVLFPGPKLFGEGSGAYAGYEKTVTFPFKGTFNGNSSGRLELALVVGLCEEVCIPARAQLAIENTKLLQSDPVTARLVDLANLAVPKTIEKNKLISEMRVAGNGRLEIKIRDDYDTESANLFVEGPDNWYLTPARKSAGEEPGVYDLDISRAPAVVDIDRVDLKFTFVSSQASVQTR